MIACLFTLQCGHGIGVVGSPFADCRTAGARGPGLELRYPLEAGPSVGGMLSGRVGSAQAHQGLVSWSPAAGVG